ncbi:Endonuclease/exonuclease/phosphatase [Corchorus capsularis]|uniref:Endonuclease/exonuclease/phosphatase n=1 Tax=Corchorus capsularis TaxID=210143 RepID=A0A1R3IGI5_COCAP|nr:Endonuclease/exonuclease/phosphatase [Corchorus capsularis]
MGYLGGYYVEPRGRSGGLALWWLDEFNLEVLAVSKNFIDIKTDLGGKEVWFCTFVYGDPRRGGRREVWEDLSRLRNRLEDKWCCIGDFNIVSSEHEKSGGLPIDRVQADMFLNFISECNLLEIDVQGANFSWSNNRTGEDNILEKLDKVYANVEWSNLFSEALGCYDVSLASDHLPLILSLEKIKKGRRDFKFESKWLLDQECSNVVVEGWNSHVDGSRMFRFSKKLSSTRNCLRNWSKVDEYASTDFKSVARKFLWCNYRKRKMKKEEKDEKGLCLCS